MPETPNIKKTVKNFRAVHAFDLRSRAEDDIAEAVGLVRDEQPGGRGLALVGIGTALCSIAATLDRLADVAEHPLVMVDGLAHADDVQPSVAELAQRIAALEKAATGQGSESIEARILVAGDIQRVTPHADEVAAGLDDHNAQAERAEIRRAVFAEMLGSVDTLREKGLPAMADQIILEVYSLGPHGDLVLEKPTTSCSADDATGVWCKAHCPARVRRESDIVARRVDCARGIARCSEHCS